MKKNHQKDTLFTNPYPDSGFAFNADVARVFDDMLSRSVPFYDTIQASITAIAASFISKGAIVYDLGCSTGTTMGHLIDHIADPFLCIGVDNSLPVLDQTKKKLGRYSKERWQLITHDLNTPFDFHPCRLVIMNLTLQFIKPKNRLPLLKNIQQSLVNGGALILIEKIQPESQYADLFQTNYHTYKRGQGYSQTEIINKSKALKNVLVPLSISENLALLKQAGFVAPATFFQWFNFAGMLAIR